MSYIKLNHSKSSNHSDPNSANYSGTQFILSIHLYAPHLMLGTYIRSLLNSKRLGHVTFQV